MKYHRLKTKDDFVSWSWLERARICGSYPNGKKNILKISLKKRMFFFNRVIDYPQLQTEKEQKLIYLYE